ncbi:MAG: Flp family type IVb pilin [Xanthobacteraceae bacterium]
MKNMIRRFVLDESGATAVEYGLIAAGISVAIVTVLFTVSRDLQSTFGNVSNGLPRAAR